MTRRSKSLARFPNEAALRTIAERHGYVETRGLNVGKGDPSKVLQAMAEGELATVLLDDDERWSIINWLDEQAKNADVLLAETIRSLALQLRDSAKQAQDVEEWRKRYSE